MRTQQHDRDHLAGSTDIALVSSGHGLGEETDSDDGPHGEQRTQPPERLRSAHDKRSEYWVLDWLPSANGSSDEPTLAPSKTHAVIEGRAGEPRWMPSRQPVEELEPRQDEHHRQHPSGCARERHNHDSHENEQAYQAPSD